MIQRDAWDAEHERHEAEQDYLRRLSDAPTAVRAWCAHFLEGATLSAQPTLDERAGWLLSALAPSRPKPQPAFDDEGE